MIGLAAEVNVLKRVAHDTGGWYYHNAKVAKLTLLTCRSDGLFQDKCVLSFAGKYHVILDESHLKDLLMQYLAPPPATVRLADINFDNIVLEISRLKNAMSIFGYLYLI